jgi:two-component system chemotaxis sensor kinase CheA
MEKEAPVSKELREQFLKEASDRLRDLERGLLHVERGDDRDAGIRLIFRGFHGIKGIAAYVNAREVIDLSNAGETLLTQVRDDNVPFRSEWVDILLGCHDNLKALLESFRDVSKPAPDGRDTLAELQRIIRSNRDGTETTGDGGDGKTLFAETAPAQIKGLEVYISKWKPGSADPRPAAALKRKLSLISKGASEAGRSDVVELIAEYSQRLEGLRGRECSTEEIAGFGESVHELRKLLAGGSAGRVEHSSAPRPQDVPREPVSRHLEIKAQYVEMLEDLVDDFSMYAESVTRNLKRLQPSVKPVALSWLKGLESDLNKFAHAFSQSCRRLHLVPLATLFERFPRLVRDIAKREGKIVDLVITGSQVELEKDQVEKLGEPVIHLIRNSVDHGLETPERRAEAGKPETGVLTISAAASKGTVTIEIRDDGRGIDFDGIRRRAVEMRLLPEKKAASLPTADLMDLVFLSGLSTKPTADTISGRGVGMDIVREAMGELDGSVEVESEPGRGTCIRLKVPWELDNR